MYPDNCGEFFMSIKFLQKLSIFAIGAVGYFFLEILWRGRSHWTMALTGGVCFSELYKLSGKKRPLLQNCFLGSAMITATEFIVGCIVNLGFKMNVWDYSDRAVHFLGQICPLYSMFWFILTAPAMWICRSIREKVFTRLQ